jgi:hypothetical protein
MKCGKFLDYSGGVSAYDVRLLLMETVTVFEIIFKLFMETIK